MKPLGKELKGRGVGAGVEEWAQKKDKMQKKSDLQVSIQRQKRDRRL